MLSSDWGYDMATRFAAAAVLCGASCALVEVVGWGDVPVAGCSEGCSCALRVSVLEGLGVLPPATGSVPCARVVRSARIELILDQCRTVPERDGYVDPVAAQALLRDQAAERWLIARGLLTGWQTGALCAGDGCGPVPSGCAERFTPGPWVFGGDVGSCARYRMEWGYQSEVLA